MLLNVVRLAIDIRLVISEAEEIQLWVLPLFSSSKTPDFAFVQVRKWQNDSPMSGLRRQRMADTTPWR